MVRLRTVTPGTRGWSRRRVGRSFSYVDHTGARLPAEDVARIKSLVIPPAWEDVWICPVPNGHIQAVGIDAAGRKQYLYHPDWRTRRDQLKFQRVTEVELELVATGAPVGVVEVLLAARGVDADGRKQYLYHPTGAPVATSSSSSG